MELWQSLKKKIKPEQIQLCLQVNVNDTIVKKADSYWIGSNYHLKAFSKLGCVSILGTMTHACNPRTQEKEEAGESGVQYQPQLHRELDVSLGFMRLCVEKQNFYLVSMSELEFGEKLFTNSSSDLPRLFSPLTVLILASLFGSIGSISTTVKVDRRFH